MLFWSSIFNVIRQSLLVKEAAKYIITSTYVFITHPRVETSHALQSTATSLRLAASLVDQGVALLLECAQD